MSFINKPLYSAGENILAVKKTSQMMVALMAALLPNLLIAATDTVATNHSFNLNLINHGWGYAALAVFVAAYALVMSEEFIDLRKSKPVLLSAGIIWFIVAVAANGQNISVQMNNALDHNILEYAQLFLFLLVAMTYVNAMEERNVFEALRSYLVQKGFSYRQLFWITGILAFFISPIADNLTTALLMCAVVLVVGKDSPKFVCVACVNIVVAANSGGAFSPFGDITTLMVWQNGILPFQNFFQLFIPSVVAYIIPAFFMCFAIPKIKPPASTEVISMKYGAKRIIFLFLVTIALAVCAHHFLHLPPMLGMMTGLSLLKFFAFYIKKTEHLHLIRSADVSEIATFDIFKRVERAEWDTLLFFFGVILSVGGLAALGYLDLISRVFYQQWGAGLSAAYSALPANVMVGILSAIIDNIPVMFAVLTMHPTMSEGQWLLVTLTAGIGGSLLSVGSAAGVALMGQARGKYTFFGHLKWIWAIAIGYFAAIGVHLWLNASLFT